MYSNVITATQDVSEHLRCVAGTHKVELGGWGERSQGGLKAAAGKCLLLHYLAVGPSGRPSLELEEQSPGPDLGPERNCKMRYSWCELVGVN